MTGPSSQPRPPSSSSDAAPPPPLPTPAPRRRAPITAVAVFGLGALVALTAGIVLWLGIGSAAQTTRSLIQERSDTVLDDLERQLRSRLEPVHQQARWIVSLAADGALDLAGQERLDAFMFGALAATPQVAALGFFRPDGRGRAWYRGARVAVREDRSAEPGARAWLRRGERAGGPSWRDPVWLDTLNEAVVLHDSPLRRDGRFEGLLAQAVPVSALSQDLAAHAPPFTTPFVLHKGRQVLAHPQLIHWAPSDTGESQPLADVREVGDPVLEALGAGAGAEREGRWLVRSGPDIDAAWVQLGDDWHLVLRREVPAYGDWTVGVHVNTRLADDQAIRRLRRAASGGLAAIVVAVGLAVLIGRRISRPVRAIAAASRAVESGRLDVVRPLRPSWIREMDEANRSFNRMVDGLRERRLIRRTLGRYVPEEVARALLSTGGRIEPTEVRATVLFCDLTGFTSLAEALGPAGIVDVLNGWFSRMVEIIERFQGTAIQFQGDAVLAAFNVPAANPEHARNAVLAALEMRAATRTLAAGPGPLECRIGIGTGPVVAGAVGASGRLSYTVYGDAVNLAARLEALNRELGTAVLLCGETAAGAGDLPLKPAGTTAVRGQSAPTRLYTLEREAGGPGAGPGGRP